MPQKPVGTRVLPTAEWFAGNGAMCGGLTRGAAGNGTQISLYNDAPAGQYLWVWEIAVGNDAASFYRIDEFEGDAGTLLQQGVYVMAGRGSAFGHTSYTDVAGILGFLPNSTAVPSACFADNEAGSMDFWTSKGPRKVLPPGYSIAVINEYGAGVGDGAILAVCFYYTILPYIPT